MQLNGISGLVKRFPAALAAMLVIAGVGSVVARAQGFDEVEIKTTKVAGNIYMLEGAGGNIGVSVGEDGVLIVDDQFDPLVPKVLEAIAKIGGDKPRFILNTHWHGDHTGGNLRLGADGTIIAQTNVRKRLAAGGEIAGNKSEPAPKGALPVITFDDSLSVHFNGEEIRAVHFPHGHTDGDSVIWFTGSNVVHMGDDLFSGLFPFVDIDSGGSVKGLMDNVAKILGELPPDARLIPGHGPLSTVSDLRVFQGMLQETTGIVAQRMKEGMTLEQIQEKGLPDKWKSWSWDFIDTGRWIAIVHRSFSEGEPAHDGENGRHH